jgi:hypothetical protein
MATREIGGIFIRDMYLLKEGDIIQGHSHKFDHCSMCVYGIARVDPCDDEGGRDERGNIIWIPKPERGAVYAAPQHAKTINQTAWVNIPKGVAHQITCMMDGTYFWCVYPKDRVG